MPTGKGRLGYPKGVPSVKVGHSAKEREWWGNSEWGPARRALLEHCVHKGLQRGDIKAFAEEWDFERATVSHWANHPTFLREWDHQMRKRYGSPEILAAQLEALNGIVHDRDAKDSDKIQAVDKYWKLLGKHQPAEEKLSRAMGELEPGDLSSLSNEDLVQAARELKKRTGPDGAAPNVD